MNENIKNAKEDLKRFGEVASKQFSEADLKQFREAAHLITETSMQLLKEIYESTIRFWESYKNTDHYQKKLNHMKRVRNREKLYIKRMAKYGRF